MNKFAKLFANSGTRMAVIGMVHVRSLPNTPLSKLSVQQLVDHSCNETLIYKKYKLNGILIENMFDMPYATRQHIGPDVTAVMTRVCTEVKRLVPQMSCGVQVLAALNCEALAVAVASGLQFIRAESYVFGHIADEGYMDACAAQLLRYRRNINAEHILVLTDVKKKHSSHAITSDLDIGYTAKAAQYFLSDGIIITGSTTGSAPHLKLVSDVRNAVSDHMPVLIGSGVNHQNVKLFRDLNVNAVIVGSHFKKDGIWSNDLCEQRIQQFMSCLDN
jgi:uncharacterized protein